MPPPLTFQQGCFIICDILRAGPAHPSQGLGWCMSQRRLKIGFSREKFFLRNKNLGCTPFFLTWLFYFPNFHPQPAPFKCGLLLASLTQAPMRGGKSRKSRNKWASASGCWLSHLTPLVPLLPPVPRGPALPPSGGRVSSVPPSVHHRLSSPQKHCF